MIHMENKKEFFLSNDDLRVIYDALERGEDVLIKATPYGWRTIALRAKTLSKVKRDAEGGDF